MQRMCEKIAKQIFEERRNGKINRWRSRKAWEAKIKEDITKHKRKQKNKYSKNGELYGKHQQCELQQI